MLSVQFKGDIEKGEIEASISGSLGFLAECSPGNAKRKLKFLSSGFDEHLSFYFNDTAFADFTLAEIGMSDERLLALCDVAECLTVIDGVSSREVKFPETITVGDFRRLKLCSGIILKQIGLSSWTMIKPNYSSKNEKRQRPLLLRYCEKLIVPIGNESYECGYIGYDFVGLWSDSNSAFLPTEEYGDDLIFNYLGNDPNAVELDGIITEYANHDVNEWHARIRKLANKNDKLS